MEMLGDTEFWAEMVCLGGLNLFMFSQTHLALVGEILQKVRRPNTNRREKRTKVYIHANPKKRSCARRSRPTNPTDP